MLKINKTELGRFEALHPGISQSIQRFEAAVLPSCSSCGSSDTAVVEHGIVGYLIHVAAASSKVKISPNAPAPGPYFCNSCESYFGHDTELT